MNVVDLHPEELLDKKEAGTLTAAEAQRLDAHLAQCSACRFEIGARADFSAELEEAEAIELGERSSVPLGAPQIMPHPIAIESAHESGPKVAPQVASRSMPPARSTRRARRGAMVLLAAAALLVAGVGWGSWREGGPRALFVALTSPAAPAPSVTEGARAKPAPRGRATPSDPTALPAASLAPIAAPVNSVQDARNASAESVTNVLTATPSLPITPSVPSALNVGHPVAASRGASASAIGARSAPILTGSAGTAVVAVPPPPAPVAVVTPVAPVSPASVASAASLFDAANGARARGDRDRAIALYHDLQSRFPGTNEARVSRVTLGRFLLDGGDANGALASFDNALRDRPGELEEEAMVGRALALRRLGRDLDEAAAWSSLLSAYPASAHAARARARLATLAR